VIGLFILPTIIQNMYNKIFSKKDTNAPPLSPPPVGGSNHLPLLHPPRTVGGYQQQYRPQQQTHLYPQHHPQHHPQQ
jgi:hypothetical protein